MDRAGWHTTSALDVPENITPIFLPSRAPELNPVENIWQYLRANWLSNRVFETYEAIIDAAPSRCPIQSHQSEPVPGRTSVDPNDRWYHTCAFRVRRNPLPSLALSFPTTMPVCA
jgi:hypothetical protein